MEKSLNPQAEAEVPKVAVKVFLCPIMTREFNYKKLDVETVLGHVKI